MKPLEAVQPPAFGEAVQVAAGVHWVRMPLPYRLDHVNVWVIEDGDGWSVVDTGADTQAAMDVWLRIERDILQGRSIRRVFGTHMHPDHIGLAGWLATRHGAQLCMSALEYMTHRMLVAGARHGPSDELLDFFRRAGWGAAAIEAHRQRPFRHGEHIHPVPDTFHRLRDGQSVRIGAHVWEVMTAYGHSPEHVCLYCEDLRLFISGDHVLPRISSNVSVHPYEPDANPMGDWFASMGRLKFRLPEGVRVLPSHHDCFTGLHGRIDQLVAGQENALERLRKHLSSPRRVLDVFSVLFRSRISEDDAHQLGLATGEATANLNYLLRQGQVRLELREGVAWYSLA